MSNHISEASRRWPDFQGGRPITLPDGQAWQFYEPAAVLRPGVDAPIPSWTFADDPALDVLLACRFHGTLEKIGMAINPQERASATLEAAWFLLARNYRLSVAEFEAIMLESVIWDASKQAELGCELGQLIEDVCSRAAEVACG